MAGPRPGSQPDIESRDNLNLAGAKDLCAKDLCAKDLCARDLGANAISCAGKNLQASLDHAPSLHAAARR